LAQVKKEDVIDRIPPRTAAWLEEYVMCQRCGKLYWRGTHCERLRHLISEILSP